jgi:hypothetical protein
MKVQEIKPIIMKKKIYKVVLIIVLLFLIIKTYINEKDNIIQLSFILDSLCLVLIFFTYSLKLKRNSLILILCSLVIIFSPIELYEGISNNKILFMLRIPCFFNYNLIYPIVLTLVIISFLIVAFESVMIIFDFKGDKNDLIDK